MEERCLICGAVIPEGLQVCPQCEENDPWDDYDHCYECNGLGDDYMINDDGELECLCDTCILNPARRKEDD